MDFIIKDNPAIQRLSRRFNNLARREQLALIILTVFTAIMVLIYGVMMPANDYKQRAEQNYRSALDTLSWMEENKPLVSQNFSMHEARDPGQSLLGIANQTSKSFRLSFKRYQPVGENGLSLWLDAVSFNNVVLWLERLDKRYNIIVKEIAVDREESKGLVNVRLVLQG